MTSIAFLRHSTFRPSCGEQSVAPEQSEYCNMGDVHHFWCCWHCGHEFETLDHISIETAPSSELIRKSLPVLLVA